MIQVYMCTFTKSSKREMLKCYVNNRILFLPDLLYFKISGNEADLVKL